MIKKTLIIFLIASSCCFGKLRSDLNNDGTVNLKDLAIFASEWLMSDLLCYRVTGTLNPDATGDYYLAGIYNGQSYYKKSDDSFYIYLLTEPITGMHISSTLGAVSGQRFFLSGTEIVGDYFPLGEGTTGTATVTAVYSETGSGNSNNIQSEIWDW